MYGSEERVAGTHSIVHLREFSFNLLIAAIVPFSDFSRFYNLAFSSVSQITQLICDQSNSHTPECTGTNVCF